MLMVPKITTEIIRLNLARQKYAGDISVYPLISVRIPTLNRSGILLERAVPSALGQTYQNKELVIVGDHCTDDTEERLYRANLFKSGSKIRGIWYNLPERNEYEKELLKDPEKRWFMGPVRATNKATELCSGEWIAHLDDDDMWTPDHLESLLEFAREGNYEFVCADYIEERYGKRKEVECGTSTWFIKKYVADVFKLDSNCWKKKWDRVSDIDVYKRMEAAQVRMGHLKKVIAYVLPRPGEKTVGYDAYMKK